MIQPEYKRAYYKLLLQGDLKGMVHLIFFSFSYHNFSLNDL